MPGTIARANSRPIGKPDCRLKLVYLPSYAPKPEPDRALLAFTKRKVLFNKAYGKFALFKQAFDDFFKNLPAYAADLVSLITDRFHLIGQPNSGIPSA